MTPNRFHLHEQRSTSSYANLSFFNYLSVFLLIMFVSPAVAKFNIKSSIDIPVLKLTTKNHDRMLILKELQRVHEELFSLNNPHHAQLYTGKNEMKCLDGTKITYSIKDINFVTVEHEASECRMNINPDYLSVFSPTPNIHEMIHRSDDIVKLELEHNIIEKFEKNEFGLKKEIYFHDFSNINYDLKCYLKHLEISQVILKETDIRVELQKSINIPETCGFVDLDKNFDGLFTETIFVDIPLNGTFYCHDGKSKSCKRTIAETGHARYKIIDDEKYI